MSSTTTARARSRAVDLSHYGLTRGTGSYKYCLYVFIEHYECYQGTQTLTKHQIRATICKSTLQPRQVITHGSGSQKVQKPQKYKGNMGTIRNHHCMSERTKLTHTRMCQPDVRESQGQVYSSPTDQQNKWNKCDQVKNENFSVRSQ